jgi:hypothetical protein
MPFPRVIIRYAPCVVVSLIGLYLLLAGRSARMNDDLALSLRDMQAELLKDAGEGTQMGKKMATRLALARCPKLQGRTFLADDMLLRFAAPDTTLTKDNQQPSQLPQEYSMRSLWQSDAGGMLVLGIFANASERFSWAREVSACRSRYLGAWVVDRTSGSHAALSYVQGPVASEPSAQASPPVVAMHFLAMEPPSVLQDSEIEPNAVVLVFYQHQQPYYWSTGVVLPPPHSSLSREDEEEEEARLHSSRIFAFERFFLWRRPRLGDVRAAGDEHRNPLSFLRTQWVETCLERNEQNVADFRRLQNDDRSSSAMAFRAQAGCSTRADKEERSVWGKER